MSWAKSQAEPESTTPDNRRLMQQYLLGPRGLKQNPRKKSRGYERNCTAKACTPATKVAYLQEKMEQALIVTKIDK